MRQIYIIVWLSAACILTACSEDFLDKKPLAVVGEEQLANEDGIYALLMGAYSLLDGIGTADNGYWQAAGSNFVYGSIASDDAYKGASAGEQLPMSQIETFQSNPNNVYFDNKWRTLYDGISRCNDVIRLAGDAEDIEPETQAHFMAEARFLRAHYHFDAVQMWGKIPFLDETITDFTQLGNPNIPWEEIEADLHYAIEHLAPIQNQAGRVSSWAAKAYLAKVHLFQKEYGNAKVLLDEILDLGPFSLEDCYHTNFRIAGNNNSESIFEIQHSVNDGSNGENGNFGDVLNYPYTGGPGACCGYHQPSHNLVNAYKTDMNGLPLLNDFNAEDIAHDEGLRSEDEFVEYAGGLDPRLDWTVGRRGIPYLDWGDHPGASWIRDQAYGGPYSPKKHVFYAAEQGEGSTSSGWAKGANANNQRLIRLAHIILWRAEVAAEEGELDLARTLVNRIRMRAANGCWVLESGATDDGSHLGPNGEEPAANYLITAYPDGHPAFGNVASARKAIRFESRLEFAMEGNRFFDLVRWEIAASQLNQYMEEEQAKRTYLGNALFQSGIHEHYPLPTNQLELMENLQQNAGY